MTNTPTTPTQPQPTPAPQRPYTAPRLNVYGTVQTLTLNTGGVDGSSGVDNE